MFLSHRSFSNYYPDFVVRMTDDSCLIVETKGQEDLDVALKDRRARRWCVDATRLAGLDWAYEKVDQHKNELADARWVA
jgi:type III restriction enzyme